MREGISATPNRTMISKLCLFAALLVVCNANADEGSDAPRLVSHANLRLIDPLWSTGHGALGNKRETAGGPQEPQLSTPDQNQILLITGLALFGAPYLTSAVVGATRDRHGDRQLFIPITGPFADLEAHNCSLQPCDGFNGSALITAGVLQSAGLVALVASAFLPRTPSERPRALSSASTSEPGDGAKDHTAPPPAPNYLGAGTATTSSKNHQ
jgi:hypothetical protein